LVLGEDVLVTGAVAWLTVLVTGAVASDAVAWGVLAELSEPVLGEDVLVTGAVVWLTAFVTGAVAWGGLTGLSSPTAPAGELHVPMATSATAAAIADLAAAVPTARAP
jgi:hypothetical protein